MVANDYACYLNKRGALTSIASRLAPTGNARAKNSQGTCDKTSLRVRVLT
ncbi:hypothetical protein EMIT0P74_110090 [Pseudomonas sp. IT-P74]